MQLRSCLRRQRQLTWLVVLFRVHLGWCLWLVLAPSYFEPSLRPVLVLNRWAKTAAVVCGVALVALDMLAQAPLAPERHILPHPGWGRMWP